MELLDKDGLSYLIRLIKEADESLISKVYPIGSIYISVSSVDPSALFGGTWEQIQDTFLLAAGTTYAGGTTGGEATHTLTVNEMPTHQHDIRNRDGNGTNGLCATNATTGTDGTNWCFKDVQVDGDSDASGTFVAANTGGGQAHNNMPPYLAVYVYKRIG